MATSAALMGENVIDSPNTRKIKTKFYKLQNHSSLVSFQQQQQQNQVGDNTNTTNTLVDVYVPDLSNSNDATNKSTKQTKTTSLTTTSTSTSSTTTANISSSSYGLSVGIVAQGLSWAKLQKNRRQRLYLQHLAEQQLYKLQLAQQQVEAQEDEFEDEDVNLNKEEHNDQVLQRNENNSNSRSFFDIPTLQSFIRLTSPFTIPNDTTTTTTSLQEQEHKNDASNNDTNNHNDTYPTISMSHISSTFDDENDMGGSISTYTNFCNLSQSGVGYSVELPKSINPFRRNHNNNNNNNNHTTTSNNSNNHQHSVKDHRRTSNRNDNENDVEDDDDDIENEDTSWIPPVRVEDSISSSTSLAVDDPYSSHTTPKLNHSNNEKNNDNINNNDTNHNNNIQNDVHPPYLLSSDEMYQIAVQVLPRNIVYSKWIRLYTLVRDGDSFDNCLRIVQNYKQSLLIIRTTKNYRFGTYVDAPWDTSYSQQHGTINYYGGPETCLFRIDDNNYNNNNNNISNPNNNDNNTDTNEMKHTKPTTTHDTNTPTANTNHDIASKVICYRWSGANRYIQLCDPQHKMFAIGGGNGTFGLCIQQDFQYGSTGTCTTFYNEPLCPDEQFHILNLEIYGFLLGQF
jgi:hypothetical protein